MGIEDRDWYRDKKKRDLAKDSWYDPKLFRQGRANYGSRKRRSSPIVSIGFWLLLGLVLYYVFSSVDNSRRASQKAGWMGDHSTLTSKPTCTPNSLLRNGATQVADPSRMRRTDVLYSGFEIENNHQYPVVAYLTDLSSGARVMGMSITSGSAAQASVPVGRYGLFFFVGSSWCNDQIGFEDGHRVNINGGLDIQSGKTSVLTLTPNGSEAPEKFHISLSQRLPQVAEPAQPAPEVRGQGFLDISQRPDGHYYIAGFVNGMPLVFLLDTGATLTSLSRDMASKAGISSCTARTFNTANGSVEGCVAKVPEFSFGNFVMRDFEVAIMPNMTNDALLGMNVLRLFQMEQQNGVMRIAVR